jgi:hypothetical protein
VLEPVSSDLGCWIRDEWPRSGTRGVNSTVADATPFRGGEVTEDEAGAGSRGSEVAGAGQDR